jgi:hypothetical protein
LLARRASVVGVPARVSASSCGLAENVKGRRSNDAVTPMEARQLAPSALASRAAQPTCSPSAWTRDAAAWGQTGTASDTIRESFHRESGRPTDKCSRRSLPDAATAAGQPTSKESPARVGERESRRGIGPQLDRRVARIESAPAQKSAFLRGFSRGERRDSNPRPPGPQPATLRRPRATRGWRLLPATWRTPRRG